MVEGQPPVVNAVEAGLGPVVGDGHPVTVPPVLVADGYQPGVHAVRLPTADELAEHHRHAAVTGGVADVVLAGALVRRVQVEGLGVRVVGARGAQVLHVGAVPGLGHRETARHRHRDDVRNERGVVTLGAQSLHGTAEQAPLHARLDHQRQVGEGQHLDRDHRRAEVAPAAVAGVEAERGLPRRREVVREPGCPRPSGLGVLAVDGCPLRAGQDAPCLGADVRPTSVQDGLQGGRGVLVALGAHPVDLTRQ